MTVPLQTRDVAERREAARALLRRPFLTAREDAEDLVLVRRHASALIGMFTSLLGYRLVVEAGFARLIKAPLTADAPHRAAKRASGGEFGPRTYTYLTLLCSALLAPDVADQALVSSLVEQLRADAAAAGVDLDDSYTDQRHLFAAFRQLITWGVLTETDGSVAAWTERREEALLSINRAALPYLLTGPLAGLGGAADLLTEDDAAELPRRSLRRKLVENPVVRREDLTDGERDALSRERTDLTRTLEDYLGLRLEVRAEGALAYDPDREVTDIEFPGPGGVRQAALLTVDELLRRHDPAAGTTADVDGRSVPGLLCAWDEVRGIVTRLATEHRRVWGEANTANPETLLDAVTDLLVAVGLARRHPDGLLLHPANGRHRAQVETAPARTRAQSRLTPTAADEPLPFDIDPEIP